MDLPEIGRCPPIPPAPTALAPAYFCLGTHKQRTDTLLRDHFVEQMPRNSAATRNCSCSIQTVDVSIREGKSKAKGPKNFVFKNLGES